ncbi:MAG TPA: CDP-glucose 4,6-dehydratase [Acidisarcina sp.]
MGEWLRPLEGLVVAPPAVATPSRPKSVAGASYPDATFAGSLDVDPTDWKGKRVFLTGHTGFKGSWFSLWLQSLGAVVRGYSLDAPTTPSLFKAAEVGGGMESVIADVRDAARLRAEMTEFRPEVVFHLAAQSLVRYSYANPLETYAVNVMGTANLLDAVRFCDSVRAVVIITTDKCYENKEWLWPYRESDRLGGHDPYSNSKACAELVTSAFRSSYFPPQRYAEHGLAIATARAGNVIGGGDWAADRLISDMMRAFTAGVPVRIRNPKSVRPWQHVLEPLRGYLMLATALREHGASYGSEWNFGPRDLDARPVIEIVEGMAQRWNDGCDGGAASFEVDGATHVHEAAQLRLDWSKAASELQWQPLLKIDDALDLTMQWYAAWRSGENVKPFTLAQIAQYARQAVAR